jgi:hypothetical protein
MVIVAYFLLAAGPVGIILLLNLAQAIPGGILQKSCG